MFVSILQLMGFPVAKPVHSRAEESPSLEVRGVGVKSKASDRATADTGQRSTPDVHAQANPARRQEVKAQPVTSKAPAKAVKPVAKAKSTVKPSSKPVAKPVPKSTVKTKVKPIAKPASPAKVAAKPVPKHAPAAKAAVKSVPKAKVLSAASKSPNKAVKPVAAKVDKVTVKVSAKDSVNTTKTKASPANAAAVKLKVSASTAPAKVASPVVPDSAALATQVLATASAMPARAGRPSSRLAQLTVPSMAQSVASTAAKASYSKVTSLPLIAPPLASSVRKDPKLANNWKTKPVEQLTDAELIAMPDDEYMNDTQMAYFRIKLSQLKQDILSNAGETTEHLREDTVVVPDPADRATIEEEHALELRTRDRERKLLKKIEQSIARIDAGDYGYCDETGEPIGVGRLLARPTANLSLEAQQRRELKQKMFGD
jgi:DnaK suppressor protein